MYAIGVKSGGHVRTGNSRVFFGGGRFRYNHTNNGTFMCSRHDMEVGLHRRQRCCLRGFQRLCMQLVQYRLDGQGLVGCESATGHHNFDPVTTVFLHCTVLSASAVRSDHCLTDRLVWCGAFQLPDSDGERTEASNVVGPLPHCDAPMRELSRHRESMMQCV